MSAKTFFIVFAVFIAIVVLLVASLGITVSYYRATCEEVEQHILSDAFKNQKVDLVYTYVDGSDPVWLKAKAKASGKSLDVNGTPDKRYVDSGELEYSVLAAQKNMGDMLGHIYIVTMNQIPAWYDVEQHTNITIVDHKTIFPPGLITFNSNVIEMYIHKIPGLSDWFLYSNDDMFINRPVTMETFFYEDEKTRFISDGWGISSGFANVVTLGLEKTASSRKFTDEVLRSRCCEKSSSNHHPMLGHAPVMINREVMEKLHEELKDVIFTASTHTFRQADDFVMTAFFYHNFMIDHGHGKIGTNFNCKYVFIGNVDSINRMQMKNMEEATFVCINDSRTANFEQTSKTIKAFLQETYAPDEVETTPSSKSLR